MLKLAKSHFLCFRILTDFGQTDFGQFFGQFSPIGAPPLWAPSRKVGPTRWGPQRVGPRRVGALTQNYVPHCKIHSFLPSLRVFSLNFGRGPSNVHVWTLWLSCETLAASGPPGLHTTARELQTRTFAFQKPKTFHKRTPREGRILW